MKTWSLEWFCGVLEVQSLGAMLGPINFRMSGGAVVQPLAIAPWANEPEAQQLPGILQRLRGEWPCVPFGGGASVANPPAQWPRQKAFDDCAEAEATEPSHGHGSHHHWQLLSQDKRALRLYIDYPDNSPIKRLIRTIAPDPLEPAVDITLEVEVKHACCLPVGLHPVLRLPDTPGAAFLRPGPFRFGRTFPRRFESLSRAAVDQRFKTLSAVPGLEGGELDFSALPLPFDSEEIVQLCGIENGFELINKAEGYGVGIQWNAVHFPSCLLWISNRGRSDYPWSSRHLALGVEPVASAFDLGGACARNVENPISAEGVSTGVHFRAQQTWETRYRIYAFED